MVLTSFIRSSTLNSFLIYIIKKVTAVPIKEAILPITDAEDTSNAPTSPSPLSSPLDSSTVPLDALSWEWE